MELIGITTTNDLGWAEAPAAEAIRYLVPPPADGIGSTSFVALLLLLSTVLLLAAIFSHWPNGENHH